MKPKVLFFLNSYAGGAEKMTLNIAGFLDPSVYEIIYYIIGKDTGLIKNFIPEGSNLNLIQVSSYKDFLISKLIKVLILEKPNFVFTSLMPLNWRLCIASIFSPKTKVIIRVNNYLQTQSGIQKIRLFITYKFANKLIVQTTEMRDEHLNILKLSQNKVITLANPVNIAAIEKKTIGVLSPFSAIYVNYVFVGRVDVVKGLDTLFDAFANVLKQQSNALLHIVGETKGIFKNYYEALLQHAQTLKISENINFVGFTDNPYTYMKYADCVVLSSLNEGLPNVIIEALFLGTPVAVTNSVPVINRIVKNGLNGYVVGVGDVDSLAFAMLNAVKLGRVTSYYTSATKEDFIKLFQN